MPRVSVIIPTYNRAQFISSAIGSVLSQTYRDFELIVVDDGSTDGTDKVVAAFDDPRLIYLPQANRGRSNARNKALASARGDYIAFLDSDDLYLPGKLALQVEYMDEHPEAGMIYTSARCIDEHGGDLPMRYEATKSGRIYKHIAFFLPVTITLPTVMVRRELFSEVGGFDEAMSRFEDTDMWRRLSKATDIHAIDVETCELRTHQSNSLEFQDPDQIISSVEYYAQKLIKEDSEMLGLGIRRGLGRLYAYYGGAFMMVSGWEARSLRMLGKAFYYWPPSWPSLLASFTRRALSRALRKYKLRS